MKKIIRLPGVIGLSIVAMTIMAIVTAGYTPTKVSAACAPLPTDGGSATMTVRVPSAGSYKVWTRIKTPDSTKNSFWMQANEAYCSMRIGGVSIPANTWTWVDYMSGDVSHKMNFTLTAGTQTIKIAGADEGVIVDRVIMTKDTACTPTGTGDNCGNNRSDINNDDFVNFLDLSVLSSNYNKSGSAVVPSGADINADGKVDYMDLSALASDYGQ